MRRKHRKEALAASVNLTSLMDITFVLLISFMIIAPAVRYDIDLELPKVQESESLEGDKPVTLQISSGNAPEYYINGVLTEFRLIIPELKKILNSDTGLALEADRNVPWEEVVKVINQLKSAEIHNLIIVTERGGA